MADRWLLRKERFEDFKLWLLADGWEEERAKGNCEVFRARKKGIKYPLSLFTKKGFNATYSVPNNCAWVVESFLADMQWAYAQKKSGIGVNSRYHFT